MAVDVEKNVFLEGFVAFGGGRYQCPGRYIPGDCHTTLFDIIVLSKIKITILIMSVFRMIVLIIKLVFKGVLKPYFQHTRSAMVGM